MRGCLPNRIPHILRHPVLITPRLGLKHHVLAAFLRDRLPDFLRSQFFNFLSREKLHFPPLRDVIAAVQAPQRVAFGKNFDAHIFKCCD